MALENKLAKVICKALKLHKKKKEVTLVEKALTKTGEVELINDLGADSLEMTELQLCLEEEFEIEIPDEDWVKIKTFRDVYNYVAANC